MPSDARVRCDKLFRVFARWAGDGVIERTLESSRGDAITPAQFRCLDFLTHRPRCSVGELAAGLGVSDPAATKLLDRLESKGLALRATRGRDHRVVHVELSKLGLELTVRLVRRRYNLVAGAIDTMSVHKLHLLMRNLESILMCALDSPEMIERICLHCGGDHTADCIVNRAYILITGAEMSRR